MFKKIKKKNIPDYSFLIEVNGQQMTDNGHC